MKRSNDIKKSNQHGTSSLRRKFVCAAWTAPVVTSIGLPVHAQTSTTTTSSPSFRLIDTQMSVNGFVTVTGTLVDKDGNGVPNQSIDITVTDDTGKTETVTVTSGPDGKYSGTTVDDSFSGVITAAVSGPASTSDEVMVTLPPSADFSVMSGPCSSLFGGEITHTFTNTAGVDLDITGVTQSTASSVTVTPSVPFTVVDGGTFTVRLTNVANNCTGLSSGSIAITTGCCGSFP